jgi:amylosucrase
MLVLANVGAEEVTVDPLTLSGFERIARDLLHDSDLDLDEGLALPPLDFVWLRVSPL